MRTSADRSACLEASLEHRPDVPDPDCLLRAAVDQLRHGMILVDRDGRLISANRAARAILAARDGLYEGPCGLRAETIGLTHRLRRMVAAAADATGTSASIALPGRVRSTPLSVGISPLRAGAALVLVADADNAPTPSPEQLRCLYGLTDAESAVTVAVTRGEGLAAVAAGLGVGIATARTHLHHVFQKTGTRRQAQLVGLIVAGCIEFRG